MFKKKEKKFTELFVRVKHERFGEGFILAYTNKGYKPIGVRFDKSSGDLGSLGGENIVKGYNTYGNSEWFSEDKLEEVKDFDYSKFATAINKIDFSKLEEF